MNKLLYFLCPLFLWCQPFPNWEVYKSNVLKIQKTIPGWCSLPQADMLLDFIHEHKPFLCVEIGTFAGSTTFPIVAALFYNQTGQLYAIDAWDQQTALEGLKMDDPNAIGWSRLNIHWEQVHQILLQWVQDLELKPFCYPIQMRSEEAVALFLEDSIDFLFLDGNFSENGSKKDVELYFPKVKKGGFIWLNRADILTKSASVGFLMKQCKWVRELSMGAQCIVFQK